MFFLRGCAQYYYGKKFIALILDPNLITSPDPYLAVDWVDEFCG